MSRPDLWKLLLVIFAGLALSAAKDAPSYPKKLENVEQALEGQALVMGSITYLKKGEVRECGELLTSCRLVILPPEGRKTMAYFFKKSGGFSWSLPPGEYTMIALDRGDNAKLFRLVFSIPANANAVYIGDLQLEIDDVLFRASAEDKYEEASARSVDQYPAGELLKALAKDDDALGNWEEFSPICFQEWGLECKWKRMGVVPVLPHKRESSSFRVEDLRPVFQWQPSPHDDVSYDLALFEGVAFKQGFLSKSYTVGRLVTYVEDISEATWRPEQPLEPKRKYFWSVRLRKGEKVSSWSRYVYSLMVGLDVAMVYGEFLRFDTPSGQTN